MRYFSTARVTDPHIALVEGSGIAQFFRSRIELAMLQVVPGQGTVGDLVTRSRHQRSLSWSAFFSAFFFGFDGSAGLGSRCQRLQFAQAGFAAVGNSGLDPATNARASVSRIGFKMIAPSFGPTGTGNDKPVADWAKHLAASTHRVPQTAA